IFLSGFSNANYSGLVAELDRAADDRLEPVGGVERRQLVHRHPLRLRAVGSGAKFSGRLAADEIEDHIVVLDATRGIAHHPVEHLDDGAELARKARLFRQLAPGRLLERLAQLDRAARHRPAPRRRRPPTLHHQHPVLRIEQHHADRDHRQLGVATPHYFFFFAGASGASLRESATPSRIGTMVVNRSVAPNAAWLYLITPLVSAACLPAFSTTRPDQSV